MKFCELWWSVRERRSLSDPYRAKRFRSLAAKLRNIGFADPLQDIRHKDDDGIYKKSILTKKSRTNPSIRLTICACSDAETACGGVCNSCSFSGNSALFSTQHQIGIVLESASGMPTTRQYTALLTAHSILLFPLLVESTITHLHHLASKYKQQIRNHSPSIPPHNIQHLKIQPPQTKTPHIHMPVRALEIHAFGFLLGGNVPTPASLICDEWETVCCSNRRDEF
jgi:hypothetical protein